MPLIATGTNEAFSLSLSVSLSLCVCVQDEYRVVGLARSGKDSVLIELRELSSRLSSLLKRKGTAAEVIGISASVIRVPSERLTAV